MKRVWQNYMVRCWIMILGTQAVAMSPLLLGFRPPERTPWEWASELITFYGMAHAILLIVRWMYESKFGVKSLLRAADWAPTARLRKKLRVFVSEQEREIKAALKKNRRALAAWQWTWTILLALFYAIREPWEAARRLVFGRSRMR